MKRYILFLAFIVAGLAASAQQNLNDSLKNERLFKLLVRLKGEVLKEISLLDHPIDNRGLLTHQMRISELCQVGMQAIQTSNESIGEIYVDVLESRLNHSRPSDPYDYPPHKRWDEPPNSLFVALQHISRAIWVEGEPDAELVTRRLKKLVPELKEAMITY